MNTAHKPLRVGLIGAGWVTQHHLAGWQHHAARARVVAITDPNAAQAQARASAFGIDQVFESAEQMLAQDHLDAIDIAAPREHHAALVRLAAHHGLPVLCQKPLAPTYEEACVLVADTESRIRLMVHENWRFRPYYRQIHQWLKAQRIGPVLQVSMSLMTSGLIADAQGQQGKYPALERQPFLATLQRALVMEILIHHIDTLRFLLGDLRLVYAQLGQGCTAMAGEDRASLVFESRDGACVTLMANLRVWGEPAIKPDELLLVGESGSIRLSGNSLSCQGERPVENSFETYDLAACYTESYAATIGHFIDGLSDGKPFETNPQDNLQTLRLVEEIYSAAGCQPAW